jgi:hypothetical protein
MSQDVSTAEVLIDLVLTGEVRLLRVGRLRTRAGSTGPV